jgi:predicted nucleic acid-binding protein
MTIIDTSVWVDHFRRAIPEVTELLATDRALMHPMVLGELCLGQMRDRDEKLGDLANLERAPVAEHDEVHALVERFKLWGRGVGWVDCHLMAAAREMDAHLLTRDMALKAAWLQVRPKF